MWGDVVGNGCRGDDAALEAVAAEWFDVQLMFCAIARALQLVPIPMTAVRFWAQGRARFNSQERPFPHDARGVDLAPFLPAAWAIVLAPTNALRIQEFPKFWDSSANFGSWCENGLAWLVQQTVTWRNI